jgi:hypothetical protein
MAYMTVNDVTPSLKFTVEEKANNKIHFLDVIISRGKNFLQFTIYRKPTTTNTITPNDNVSSSGVQVSGLVIINRMMNYPISEPWKKDKLEMKKFIAFNNKYSISKVIKFACKEKCRK